MAALMHYEAQRTGCDLIVTTGDNFYRYGVASVDDPQWRSSYENIYSPELRRLPWFPVAGNHDWGGSMWAQLDRTGRDGWHMPWLWYDIPGSRFGRPDLHMFFIDTTVWKGREKSEFGLCGQVLREKDIVRQRKWLADALRASCAPTKLVFGHHPVYATGGDGGGRAMIDLDKLLIETNVTAYICGHRHCLYHVSTNRLDYICSGGGSEERPRDARGRFAPDCVAEGDCIAGPRLERFIGLAGFAKVDTGQEALSFTFVDRNGRETPPATIRSRGNHALGCSGPLPVDPAMQRERDRASARTLLPCASLT